MANIDADAKPKYRYFDMLSFLDPVMDDDKNIQYEQIEWVPPI